MIGSEILMVGDIHHAPPEAGLRLDQLCGRPRLSGEALHRHLFEAGGDVAAIEALGALWPAGAIGVGFSAAGTLLWRAALAGVPLGGLICVSSTRLRLEAHAPDVARLLIWGGADPAVPGPAWQELGLSENLVVQDAAHDFYARLTSEARGVSIARWCKVLQAQIVK